MFGWFKSRKHHKIEMDRLRSENFSLKQAVAASPAAMVSGNAIAPSVAMPNLANHANQLDHFRGWQYVCIRAIATRAAGQDIFVASAPDLPPGQLMRKMTSAELEPMSVHPLLAAIDEPNELMTRWALLYVTVANLQLTGRAYWWLRPLDGRVTIWPLPADWVKPKYDQHNNLIGWHVRPRGNPQGFELPPEEVAPFTLPDPKDPYNNVISPLSAQSPAINADEALQDAQYNAFQNGIFPAVILKVGKRPDLPGMPNRLNERVTLTPEQRSQLINAIKNAYGGVERYGGTAIVDGLIEDIVPFSRSVKEMDFLSSTKSTKSRIFQAFGVNPLIVGEIEGANRAQAVVAEQSFCQNVMNPLLSLLGQTITKYVGPVFAVPGEKLHVWFEKCKANDDELRQKDWHDAANRGFVDEGEYRKHVLNMPQREAQPDNASLNGAQLQQLVNIIALVSQGILTRETARATIVAAFPIAPEMVDAIVDTIEEGSAVPPAVKRIAAQLNPYNLERLSTDAKRETTCRPPPTTVYYRDNGHTRDGISVK
jgi:phage portal protein BeeE